MTEIDPLSGVAVFVAAARAGGFNAAAARLGITKSAVGKSIARLELRLGLKLFHRTTRQNKLTRDGEAYFAACIAALDGIAAAEAALKTANRVLSGRIHINMPVAFGRKVLLPILLDILRPHPALTLSLTFTDAIVDPMQDDVDLVIRFGALKDTSDLAARHLVDLELMICASPKYVVAHGRPQDLAALKTHRCIVGSGKGPPQSWLVRDGGSMKRISPPATHQIDDGEAIVDAALGGLGICQMPSSLLRHHIKSGTLVALLEEFSRVPVQVHALWPRRAQISPRLRYVVDQLVSRAKRGELD
jgi:DNA-binding transcriptional LysR family regulator